MHSKSWGHSCYCQFFSFSAENIKFFCIFHKTFSLSFFHFLFHCSVFKIKFTIQVSVVRHKNQLNIRRKMLSPRRTHIFPNIVSVDCAGRKAKLSLHQKSHCRFVHRTTSERASSISVPVSVTTTLSTITFELSTSTYTIAIINNPRNSI